MKLQQITEWAQAPLPRELRELYRNYWDLRTKALHIAPAMDPYICNIITPQIFDHLKSLHIPVQIHSGSMDKVPIHMWAKVQLPARPGEPPKTYTVDGSYYQAHYTKPTTNIIPGPLGQKLTKAGITNLYKLLGVVDSKLMGEHQGFLDVGDIESDFKDDRGQSDYDKYTQHLQQVAATLTAREIKTIQGRLLPLLLYIIPDTAPTGDHEGNLYDPETADIHPEWEAHTGPILGNDEYYTKTHRPVPHDEF